MIGMKIISLRKGIKEYDRVDEQTENDKFAKGVKKGYIEMDKWNEKDKFDKSDKKI